MKNSINFLPKRFRRIELVRKRLRFWLMILIIAISVVGYDYHNECNAYQADLQMLRARQSRYAHLAGKQRKLAELQRQLAAEQASGLNSIVPPSADYALNMLGIVSSSARAYQGKLWVEELRMTRNPSSIPNATCALNLKGKALDNLVVARFAATLRETGVFQQVKLKPPQRQNSDSLIRGYAVECIR